MNTTTLTSHGIWRSVRFYCLAALLVAWCGVPHAQEQPSPTYVPARFGTGDDSLLGQLQCPDKRGPPQRVVLFCQAQVGTDGRLANRGSSKSNRCIGAGLAGDTGDAQMLKSSERYISAIYGAFKKARFLPAQIDGVAVAVNFPFQVVVEDRDGCVVTALPNLGDQSSELGGGYVAPQEIVTDGGWIKRMKFFDPFDFPFAGVIFSVSVSVDEKGNATDKRIEYATPVSASRSARSPAALAAEAATALERSKFIPGFYRGTPFTSRYLQLFFIPSARSVSTFPRAPGAGATGPIRDNAPF